MSSRRGPPKHQNKFAWRADAGHKKNETEPGGRFRPLAEISGVCNRCKDQIEWKRKYGKYKMLKEPAKCNQCGNRAVRQAYHTLCASCAKQRRVCAKCSCPADSIVGRDLDEVESERKQLEEALKHAKERERRTLLRAMNKRNPGMKVFVPVAENEMKSKEHVSDNSGCHSEGEDASGDEDDEFASDTDQ